MNLKFNFKSMLLVMLVVAPQALQASWWQSISNFFSSTQSTIAKNKTTSALIAGAAVISAGILGYSYWKNYKRNSKINKTPPKFATLPKLPLIPPGDVRSYEYLQSKEDKIAHLNYDLSLQKIATQKAQSDLAVALTDVAFYQQKLAEATSTKSSVSAEVNKRPMEPGLGKSLDQPAQKTANLQESPFMVIASIASDRALNTNDMETQTPAAVMADVATGPDKIYKTCDMQTQTEMPSPKISVETQTATCKLESRSTQTPNPKFISQDSQTITFEQNTQGTQTQLPPVMIDAVTGPDKSPNVDKDQQKECVVVLAKTKTRDGATQAKIDLTQRIKQVADEVEVALGACNKLSPHASHEELEQHRQKLMHLSNIKIPSLMKRQDLTLEELHKRYTTNFALVLTAQPTHAYKYLGLRTKLRGLYSIQDILKKRNEFMQILTPQQDQKTVKEPQDRTTSDELMNLRQAGFVFGYPEGDDVAKEDYDVYLDWKKAEKAKKEFKLEDHLQVLNKTQSDELLILFQKTQQAAADITMRKASLKEAPRIQHTPTKETPSKEDVSSDDTDGFIVVDRKDAHESESVTVAAPTHTASKHVEPKVSSATFAPFWDSTTMPGVVTTQNLRTRVSPDHFKSAHTSVGTPRSESMRDR